MWSNAESLLSFEISHVNGLIFHSYVIKTSKIAYIKCSLGGSYLTKGLFVDKYIFESCPTKDLQET